MPYPDFAGRQVMIRARRLILGGFLLLQCIRGHSGDGAGAPHAPRPGTSIVSRAKSNCKRVIGEQIFCSLISKTKIQNKVKLMMKRHSWTWYDHLMFLVWGRRDVLAPWFTWDLWIFGALVPFFQRVTQRT